MFKRYMIVLAVFAFLTTGYVVYQQYKYSRHNNWLEEIHAECKTITIGTEEWKNNCDQATDYSRANIAFNLMIEDDRVSAEYGKYTGYILFLMLVSGVLRWIWNGRNK